MCVVMTVRMSVWMGVREILTDTLTAVQFCVSGLPKEDLVNVTHIGKCQDECQGECQGNTDSDNVPVLCGRITSICQKILFNTLTVVQFSVSM